VTSRLLRLPATSSPERTRWLRLHGALD